MFEHKARCTQNQVLAALEFLAASKLKGFMPIAEGRGQCDRINLRL